HRLTTTTAVHVLHEPGVQLRSAIALPQPRASERPVALFLRSRDARSPLRRGPVRLQEQVCGCYRDTPEANSRCAAIAEPNGRSATSCSRADFQAEKRCSIAYATGIKKIAIADAA